MNKIRSLLVSALAKSPNGIHAERGKFHEVFRVDGVSYFCYDDLGNTSVNRSEQIDSILRQEAEYRIKINDLDEVFERLNKMLDGSDGKIRAGEARDVINEMRNRFRMLPHEMTIYRLAACLYFTAKDDPGQKLGLSEIEQRAETFKKKDCLATVLSGPISNMLNFRQLLATDSPESLSERIRTEAARYDYSDQLVMGR